MSHEPVIYTEKSEACDACGFETEALTEVDAYARTQGHGPFTPEEEKARGWLCAVCMETHSGNAYCYPRQYPDCLIHFDIARCTNIVLAEIRRATGGAGQGGTP